MIPLLLGGSAPEAGAGGTLLGPVDSPVWGSAGVGFVPHAVNMYMKPLGAVIRSFGVRCHQYADDTQLSFSSSSGEAVEVLNWCMGATMDWMRANKLRCCWWVVPLTRWWVFNLFWMGLHSP